MMGVFQNIVFPMEQLFRPGMEGGVMPPPASIQSSVDGKTEQRIRTASEGRYSLRIAPQTRTHAQRVALYEFYMGVGGMEDSFLVMDPRTYFNTVAGQSLGSGDGTTVNFQLVHAFGSYLHTVNKPVSGTVAVYINDVAQASRWSVNLTTGIVTFSADLQYTITNATSSGANTILFAGSNMLSVGDSIYLSGFSGNWAALNGQRFLVLARSGGDITIAHDSSAYAAYSSNGGQINTLPQSGEAVSADCQHYYQVRFNSEMRGPDIVLSTVVSLGSLEMLEVRE